jgi:hypothetical protein
VRLECAAALVSLRDTSRDTGITLANACLYDREVAVRRGAASAIKLLGSQAGVDTLIDRLFSGSATRLVRGAEALKVIDNQRAFRMVVGRIKAPKTRRPVAPLRSRVVNIPTGPGVRSPVMLEGGGSVQSSGTINQPAVTALRIITGRNHGTDVAAWMDWLVRHEAEKAGKPLPPRVEPDEKRSVREKMGLPREPGILGG